MYERRTLTFRLCAGEHTDMSMEPSASWETHALPLSKTAQLNTGYIWTWGKRCPPFNWVSLLTEQQDWGLDRHFSNKHYNLRNIS